MRRNDSAMIKLRGTPTTIKIAFRGQSLASCSIMTAIWIHILISLLAATFVTAARRQIQNKVDVSSCDSNSISSVVPAWEVENFKRKQFSNCTIRSGELAAITNRINLPIDVDCRNEVPQPGFTGTSREGLRANNVAPNKAFVMNVYVSVENMVGPRWKCDVRRSDRTYDEFLNFTVFTDYRERQSFNFEVTSSGLYEQDPRLVTRWEMSPKVP